MNRSPEHRSTRLDEAVLEDRIVEAADALGDPALRADAALRAELRALEAPVHLPPALKQRVMAQATPRRRWPALPMALAAGLAGVMVLVTAVREPAPTPVPSSKEAESLRLAFETVDRTSREALGRAGREVAEHLKFPAMEIEQLPYGHLLRSFVLVPPRAPQPEEK